MMMVRGGQFPTEDARSLLRRRERGRGRGKHLCVLLASSSSSVAASVLTEPRQESVVLAVCEMVCILKIIKILWHGLIFYSNKSQMYIGWLVSVDFVVIAAFNL